MAKATRAVSGCRYARVSVSRLSSLHGGSCQQSEGSTCQSQDTRCSFSDYSIKVFVNNKNFEWQTPLTMDDFQAVLLTGVETTRNCYDPEALAYTRP
jgi:hypothetical protein